MCALRDGLSRDTSMGFTAVDGIMMGTRTGSIDPGVMLHLIEQKGMDAKALSNLVYKQSGLLGVSGISQDMRALLESDEVAAKEAIELFCYRAACMIGQLTMAAGGFEALVFTGGIGEHAARSAPASPNGSNGPACASTRPPTTATPRASTPRTARSRCWWCRPTKSG
jgi:acetate kinase